MNRTYLALLCSHSALYRAKAECWDCAESPDVYRSVYRCFPQERALFHIPVTGRPPAPYLELLFSGGIS